MSLEQPRRHAEENILAIGLAAGVEVPIEVGEERPAPTRPEASEDTVERIGLAGARRHGQRHTPMLPCARLTTAHKCHLRLPSPVASGAVPPTSP
jgi:hypothetical protein